MILCEEIEEIKDNYVKELEKKLNKIALGDYEKETTNMITQDMRMYLNQIERKCITTQYIVGIKLIFKG